MKHKNCVVIGSFAPPHIGHLYMIDTASAYAQHTHVLIYSYDNKDFNYIDGPTRFNWLTEIYKDYDNITVKLIEDVMPQSPEEHGDYNDFFNIWTKDIQSRVPGSVDIVCGSEDYVIDLAKFIPNCDYKIIDKDRIIVPISGTVIRQNPLAHWDFIHPVCRPYFNKKICIVGGESCGKSIMVKQLARALNTNFVEEYGRFWAAHKIKTHEEFPDHGWDIWTERDFKRIVNVQISKENKALNLSNKFLICDTDPITTQCFHKLYLGVKSDDIQKIIDEYKKPDIYFLLSPEVPFINDGTREFENKRQEQFDLLKEELELNQCNYIIVNDTDYQTRFEKVLYQIKHNLF